MKIVMISRWNAACGVSVHAELIGRAWRDMGYKVSIFAPIEHATTIQTHEDESWVIRCYRLDSYYSKIKPWSDSLAFFNPKPFLENEYDLFIAQNLEILPMEFLHKIFPEIKKKAKTFLVIHEGKLPRDPNSYKFEWERIICFDQRYKNFLIKAFPEDKICIIPYPCHPVKLGDTIQSRKKLELPLDKKIILNFGIGVYRHLHLLPIIERLNVQYPLIFLVVTSHPDWFELWNSVTHRYKFVRLIKTSLFNNEKLYHYLHASDALLIHKDSSEAVVVASTVYLCLGSGYPILAHATNFVETLNKEIMKYSGNPTKRLIEVFEEKDSYKLTLQKALEYAENNSSFVIAKKFIQLFNQLKL